MTEQELRLAALNAAVATPGPQNCRVDIARRYYEFINPAQPEVIETKKATKKNG